MKKNPAINNMETFLRKHLHFLKMRFLFSIYFDNTILILRKILLKVIVFLSKKSYVVYQCVLLAFLPTGLHLNIFHTQLIWLRAISLKNRRGGEENLRDPLGQNWDFFNPLAKNGYFHYPLGHKTGFFYPLGHCFLPVTPPDSFVQFYHPQTAFSANLPPLGQFFLLSIWPPSDSFLSILPPLDSFFHPFYRPSDTFSWDPPRTKKMQSKTRMFSTLLGQKGHFLPPPVFLME